MHTDGQNSPAVALTYNNFIKLFFLASVKLHDYSSFVTFYQSVYSKLRIAQSSIFMFYKSLGDRFSVTSQLCLITHRAPKCKQPPYLIFRNVPLIHYTVYTVTCTYWQSY